MASSSSSSSSSSSFWKINPTAPAATKEQAQYIAEKIQSGKFVVTPTEPGERIYKNAGWCFDLAPLAGYKPYMVEYHFGEIRRVWSRSIAEVRNEFRLSQKDKVVRYERKKLKRVEPA